MSKAVRNKLSVRLNVLNNIKESSDDSLSRFFLIWIIHNKSLLFVICLKELVNAGGGSWRDHVVSLMLVQFSNYLRYFDVMAEFCSLVVLVVGEVAAVHQN